MLVACEKEKEISRDYRGRSRSYALFSISVSYFFFADDDDDDDDDDLLHDRRLHSSLEIAGESPGGGEVS